MLMRLSAADKQRAYRRRRHDGRSCYRIELSAVEAEELLRATGLLPFDVDDRVAVEQALQQLVERLITDHAGSTRF